jgi:hypothetical protein
MVWFDGIEINLERSAHEREISNTLGRIEVIARSTSHIETMFGSLPPPVIKIGRRNPVAPPTAPQSSALMEFDHTAMFGELNSSTGALRTFVPGNPLSVNFYFSNHGTGVAHKVLAAVSIGLYFGSNPDNAWEDQQFASLSTNWKNVILNNSDSLEDIPSGETRFKTMKTPFVLNDSLTDDLTNGRKLFYVFGIIGWQDGAGTHRTEICSWLQPPGNVAIWHNCTSGHNSIELN